jgi:hypothetical protein
MTQRNQPCSMVRVIYTGLALLMGVGLVGFGVGSFGSGGGLFNSLSSNEGTNAASFSSKIKKYEKLTKQNPRNVVAWEGLAKALLHEAGAEEVTPPTGVTSKGRALYVRASQAWNSYIALNPPKPSAELAQLMFNYVYSEAGLNEPSKAVEVLQIIVVARPTAAYYSQLAIYAYKVHNTRLGDLSAAKAVSLAPANARTRLKRELSEYKLNPSGEKVVTTKTNGKTYEGKLNSKGEVKQAKVVPSKTSKATTTTGTTKK